MSKLLYVVALTGACAFVPAPAYAQQSINDIPNQQISFGMGNGTITMNGSTSGSVALTVSSVAGAGSWLFRGLTDSVVGANTTDVFTNKTFDTAGTGNLLKIGGVALPSNAPQAHTCIGSPDGLAVGWNKCSQAVYTPPGVSATAAGMTAQTALSGSSSTGGLYAFRFYAVCSGTATPGGNAVITLTWNDGAQPQTIIVGTLPLSAGSYTQGTQTIWTANSQNITWAVAYTPGTGAAQTYTVHAMLERLQ